MKAETIRKEKIKGIWPEHSAFYVLPVLLICWTFSACVQRDPIESHAEIIQHITDA